MHIQIHHFERNYAILFDRHTVSEASNVSGLNLNFICAHIFIQNLKEIRTGIDVFIIIIIIIIIEVFQSTSFSRLAFTEPVTSS